MVEVITIWSLDFQYINDYLCVNRKLPWLKYVLALLFVVVCFASCAMRIRFKPKAGGRRQRCCFSVSMSCSGKYVRKKPVGSGGSMTGVSPAARVMTVT